MFDSHVHSAPCVFPRLADDVGTASMYVAAGFTGCVLKGHSESTVTRAEAARRVAGIEIYGGIVLNRSVGGLAPQVVRDALADGARVVWMPTLDAAAHRAARLPLPPGHSATPIPVPPDSDRGLEALTAIVRAVAEADAVLATGHLSAPQCAWLVAAARAQGVRRVLLTHATFSVPAMTHEEVLALVEQGAVCEITAYQLRHRSNVDDLARLASELGADRCVLASDAGQPDAPAPPDALASLVEQLVAAGLDPGAARAMASERPQTLVAP
jgi:hypothetical protein